MLKKFLFILACLTPFLANAQVSIHNMIAAEKNFASYSVAHGTKDAFLNFLDSAGIVFDKGAAVKGIEFWSNREKVDGILDWHPRVASMAASGDFGFTSGPWTFRDHEGDSIKAGGTYITVWHLNESKQWKFLVDMGVWNTPPVTDTIVTLIENARDVIPGTLSSMLESEKQFILQSGNPAKAYAKFISKVGIINRNGTAPLRGVAGMKEIPQNIAYSVLGSGISTSGDMGYVYGTTTINGKKENYLRIWRREQEKWVILLEVLRF